MSGQIGIQHHHFLLQPAHQNADAGEQFGGLFGRAMDYMHPISRVIRVN